MSVHLYNLGADMSISTGVDRLGKVVFWVLVAGGMTASIMLLLGGMPSNLSFSFAAIVAAGCLAGYLAMNVGGKPKHTLGANVVLFYAIAMGVFTVNKVPNSEPFGAVGFYALMWCVVLLIYLGAKKVSRYVFDGFAK